MAGMVARLFSSSSRKLARAKLLRGQNKHAAKVDSGNTMSSAMSEWSDSKWAHNTATAAADA